MQQPLGELASFGSSPGPSRQLNSVFASSQQQDVGTAAGLAEVTSQTLQLFPKQRFVGCVLSGKLIKRRRARSRFRNQRNAPFSEANRASSLSS